MLKGFCSIFLSRKRPIKNHKVFLNHKSQPWEKETWKIIKVSKFHAKMNWVVKNSQDYVWNLVDFFILHEMANPFKEKYKMPRISSQKVKA